MPSRRVYPTYIVPDDEPPMDTPPDITLKSSNIYASPHRVNAPQKSRSHMRTTPMRGGPRLSRLDPIARMVKAASDSECEKPAPTVQPSGGGDASHLAPVNPPAALPSLWRWVFSAFYLAFLFLILPFIIGACVCYGNLAHHAYDFGGNDLLVRFLKSDIGLQETADFALLFAVSFCALSCIVKGVLAAVS